MIRRALILGLSTCLCITLAAQETKSVKFRVNVVSFGDKVGTEAANYVERELRSVSDVEVTDTNDIFLSL